MTYTLEYFSQGQYHYQAIDAVSTNDAVMRGQRWLQLNDLQDVIDRGEWSVSKDE